jgi:hypothetical protein
MKVGTLKVDSSHRNETGSVSKHKDFMLWIGKTLGYKQLEDYYNLNKDIILSHGGSPLLEHYKTPYNALQTLYPDFFWLPWKFGSKTKGWIEDLKNDRLEMKKIMDWLGNKFSVKNLDEWYRVSWSQIVQEIPLKGKSQLVDMLRIGYPEHRWNESLFFKGMDPSKANQRKVAVLLKELFPLNGNRMS